MLISSPVIQANSAAYKSVGRVDVMLDVIQAADMIVAWPHHTHHMIIKCQVVVDGVTQNLDVGIKFLEEQCDLS